MVNYTFKCSLKVIIVKKFLNLIFKKSEILSINFWVCIIIDFILNHSINISNRKTKPSKGGNEIEKNISGNVDDI
jgi:hypothetical protein